MTATGGASILRIGKNYSYMIRGLHAIAGDESKCIAEGKAVIEHHFNNHHEFCGK
jgi:hypothetical protein